MLMDESSPLASVEWLIRAIVALPSDDPVPLKTPGYNNYTTQKAHWLGWLNPSLQTGTYSRSSGNDGGARNVYNRIVEPKMLLWLIAAAGVRKELADAALGAAAKDGLMPGKAAAVRKHVPWGEVETALLKNVKL